MNVGAGRIEIIPECGAKRADFSTGDIVELLICDEQRGHPGFHCDQVARKAWIPLPDCPPIADE